MNALLERISPKVSRFIDRPQHLLIDGDFRPAIAGRSTELYDPARDVVIGTAADAERADVDDAVAAARRALSSGPWRSMTAADRGVLLGRLADLIEANASELAQLETLNNGSLLAVNRNFAARVAATHFRYAAGACARLCGQSIPLSAAGEWHAYTLREPVGVAALIVPWNAPLLLTAQKLAPALAAGCTVLLKPARETPLTALWLGKLVLQAGIPAGVVNVVTGGAEVGQALSEHADIDKISFTGSTAVGKLVARAATGNLKRVTLELGGKSPVIVFPDCDVDRAIAGAAGAIFRNAGQTCVAGSRLFVHESIQDRVVEGICGLARTMRLGHGLDEATQMGPLVSRAHQRRVLDWIARGQAEGAELLTGGVVPDTADCGYFVEPTVFTGVAASMSVMREEIFGPVLCVSSFHGDLEPIADRANDSPFGLSASIWTQDLRTAHRMARLLKAGTVTVNAHGGMDAALPFGGVKQSGWGRECADEGILSYTETKSVSMCLDT